MVRWTPAGDRIASASWDETVAITDASTGELLHRIEGHTSYVNCVAWSHDGTMLASGSLEEPYVLVWDSTKPHEAATEFVGHTSSVEALEWSPTDPLLASASSDGTVRIWSASGTVKYTFYVGDSTIPYLPLAPDVSWSPDGTLLAAADDQRVWVWESETGRRIGQFVADEDGYENEILGWRPNSRSLAVLVPSDDAVKVWEIDTGRQITTIRTGMIEEFMERLRSEE
jgi:WD40 repeat protein